MMERMRDRTAGIFGTMVAALTEEGRTPRRPRRALECDALESRQLLSFGGGGLPNFGHAHHGMMNSMEHRGPIARGGLHGRMAAVAKAGAAATSPTTAPTTPTTATDTTATTQVATPTADAATTSTPAAVAATTTTTTTTAAAATTSTPPAAPSPQQQADFTKLQDDIHATMLKSQVTIGQQTMLRDDLQAIAKAATGTPSQASVTAIQADLAAIQGTYPTDAQVTQLETDFTTLVKSEGVTDQATIDKAIADATTIFKASNLTADDVTAIAADQKQIQTDLGASAPAGTSAPVGPMDGIALPGLGELARIAQGGGAQDGPGYGSWSSSGNPMKGGRGSFGPRDGFDRAGSRGHADWMTGQTDSSSNTTAVTSSSVTASVTGFPTNSRGGGGFRGPGGPGGFGGPGGGFGRPGGMG